MDDDLNFYNARTKRRLTPHLGSDGYIQVVCKDENQKSLHERVHVILAHCFIPNPNGYRYINHKDSDKTNNSLDNLEWCTNSYNVKHCWDSGNRTHKNNTKIQAKDKNGNIKTYKSIREAGRDLHLDRHKIVRILKGEIPNRYEYEFNYI